MAATKTTLPIISVITAQALSNSQTSQVKKILSERVGEAEVQFKTDAKILGGVQVRLGDQQFDASLEGQLQRLQLSQDRCVITTAIPLTSTQRTKLTQAIIEKHGSVTIEEVVDPKVIGGIRIVIGSKEYDRTVAGRLHQLQQQAQQTV